MKIRTLFCSTLTCALALVASQCGSRPVATTSASEIPHLQKHGTATQLIVDGKPFLARAGELSNNAATSVGYMQPIWPNFVEAKLNTVLAGVSWAQVEPQEGKFDFSVLDGIVRDARNHNLRLVLLWFASYKNGSSSYPPDWLKKDFERFPRVQVAGGKSIEMLSPFSDANRDADARAFAALMRHVKRNRWPPAHGHHDPGRERGGNAVGLPRPLDGGQSSFRWAGPEGTDGLPSGAQGHPDSGASPSVAGGGLQNRRDLGRGVRQGSRDG